MPRIGNPNANYVHSELKLLHMEYDAKFMVNLQMIGGWFGVDHFFFHLEDAEAFIDVFKSIARPMKIVTLK
jgi:hypothetical protein